MRLAPVIRWAARTAAGLLLAALIVGPAEAGGGNANSAVMPVNSKPYGLTYGQWSGLQWRWLFSMPADEHPLADTAPAETNQSGKVWFLGGTFTQTNVGGIVLGEADRTITIPNGTSLFFPLLDVESSNIEGNGTTGAELAAASKALADLIDPDNLFLEIDGKSVTNLDKYRVVSPVFPIGPLPEDNLLNLPEGTTGISVSDGYFVMLHPLSAGKHTLHFGGLVDLTSVGGPVFALDITYHVTVGKAK